MKIRSERSVKATINQHNLHYTDQGKGLPVVFIHAFPLNRRMWDPQISTLQARFRVIAVDLRGHGESGSTSGAYTIDDLASDVKGLLDHLRIRRAVLVGLSMGGYVLFAFYRRFVDRVKGLVLADTRPQPDTADGRAGRLTMIQTAESKGAGAIADIMLPKLLSPDTIQNKLDLVHSVRAMIESTPVGTIQRDLRAMLDRADSTPLLSTISCPTLILVGALDQATPPADSRQMADGIPHARLHIIADAAHLSNLEQPAAFNTALTAFFETIPDGT
jgi:3-oxoadipate enol-lactonase